MFQLVSGPQRLLAPPRRTGGQLGPRATPVSRKPRIGLTPATRLSSGTTIAPAVSSASTSRRASQQHADLADAQQRVDVAREHDACVQAAAAQRRRSAGQGDECVFVHHGRGVIHTQFGTLEFGPKDYVVIPKGTIYRMIFDETPEDAPNPKFIVFETANGSHILPPPRYLSKTTSQFLEHAPYCERDLRVPELPLTFDEAGTFEVRQNITKGAIESFHGIYTNWFNPLRSRLLYVKLSGESPPSFTAVPPPDPHPGPPPTHHL